MEVLDQPQRIKKKKTKYERVEDGKKRGTELSREGKPSIPDRKDVTVQSCLRLYSCFLFVSPNEITII